MCSRKQEGVNEETALVTDAINRARSRIVQSPERIKRNIVTMGTTAAEDKKTVAMHESKIRDLQTKITALLNIEKASSHFHHWLDELLTCSIEQEVRSCVEQLQTIEKEMHALDTSQKELTDLKDNLDQRKGERNELLMKREVRLFHCCSSRRSC